MQFEFEDISLFVQRAKVTPGVIDAHRRALRTAPAKYPITRAQILVRGIEKGRKEITLDNLVFGQLPRRVILGLVNAEAYTGSGKNPFRSENFKVNYISCRVDGEEFPTIAYQPNYDAAHMNYSREIFNLYKALDQDHSDPVLSLDNYHYPYDHCLYAFDLAADLSNGVGLAGHYNFVKRGMLGVQIKFRENLLEPVYLCVIYLIMYAEYDSIIEIDSEGKVTRNY